MQMSGWLDANPTLAKESTQCYDSAITADCSDPGEPTVAASTGRAVVSWGLRTVFHFCTEYIEFHFTRWAKLGFRNL